MKGGRVLTLFAVFAVFTLSAQQKAFKTDAKTGVQYRFIKHAKNGAKGHDTDLARAILAYSMKNKAGKDSDAFDSHIRGGDSSGALYLVLKKKYYASLEEGLLMMSPGDSAEFLINADSLYLKFFNVPPNRIPPGVTASTIFTFRIKLLEFKTQSEVQKEQAKLKQKMMAKIIALKTQEPSDIKAFLQKHNYNVQPDADSIFYLDTKPGNGKMVKDGDSIFLKYTGRFLDGKGFDSSSGHGPGNEIFKLQFSQNMPLIRGWISILGKMQEGEKVLVLIPSSRGYGARGGGPIPPYSPLIFDMELVKVISTH